MSVQEMLKHLHGAKERDVRVPNLQSGEDLMIGLVG